MTAPAVSVLLVSWNTREETRQCLAALQTAGRNVRYEVVAVDNASRDGSAELLAATPEVKLIRNRRNLGFAEAVNQAYRAAAGELILLLNSDVRVDPGALETMLGFLRDHPDAAGVSPLYLNADGSFQQHYVQQPEFRAAVALFTMLRHVPGFRGSLRRFQMHGEDFSRPRTLASGSCMLLRRRVLPPDRILDERFPIYWNDAILARGLDAAGHQLWMIPDAVVTHTRGASCRRLGPAMRFRHLLGSLVVYLSLTQPRYRITLFRLALLANHALRTGLGRSTILGLGDLLAALRGDTGPLPDGDIRDWEIVVTQARVAGPAGPGPDQRLLQVELPGNRPRWRFIVHTAGDSAWRAELPTALPFGGIPLVRWLNQRIGAACLRRWLDRHAGARVLRVDVRHRQLAGWLGEDITLRVGEAPKALEPARG